MHSLKHSIATLILTFVCFALCIMLFARPGVTPVAQAEEAAPADIVPLGGFTGDGSAVNSPGTTGKSPALVINPAGEVWAALQQNDQIVVSKFNPTTKLWAQQGSNLNTNAGRNPALARGGTTGSTLWAAWTEGAGATSQIKTARLEGSSWQPTGALPLHSQDSDKAALATGATVTDAIPMPWVAWGSGSGVVVKRALTDSNGPGGIGWESVGTTLTLASATATAPDLGFAGAGNRTPWVAWPEASSDGKAFIFAARGVADSNAPGELVWQPVGKVAGCAQTDCALNADPQQAAQGVKLATGALLGEATTSPWVVFAATTASHSEIRVMRLDDGATADSSDDRFIAVGGAVNTQCLQAVGITPGEGSQPDIFFVGTVPHVAWIETKAGVGQLFVCHLGDTRPGQARWDLDTNVALNQSTSASAAAPVLSTNGNTPYVAWQEGESQNNIFVAHRYPDGPAWGSNRPPFIRTISWSRNLVGRVYPDEGIARAIDDWVASTNPLTLTTSCDHVNGWEHIREIQFKVANSTLTAFSGKYVAAEDKVYVEDPAHPGTFLGGVKPGSNTSPIATAIATLYVANMRVHAHGNSSPALDIDWSISFNTQTMFQDLKQMINIVYDDGQATGFFETGVLSFDYRIYMPAIQR